ncbi:GlxA family transcriptional regulator [Actinoplanes derwentensis]|uniref:Transcriptional regulator GlxA family, contains an amidase domain and an AraC-type DNA-binding HTH domain n=1 Tax=Actinoplanes derwentensis TaxID=113562 RepID=A0A1H2D6Z6_9ACTN|nr:helix-turn-helix domain-containing protein [Actinoplanes derwentensis]GID85568.1 AraC family transcriptional regulator [Actinoplanes derwentensis]SDT78327.1 Transcriptional regulator GlxA family, contains an amidase domain and an AraC-type DNA-binding HTH domain [Actinoplanes derwentensis]
MLRSVAVIVMAEVAVFELGVLCEMFGYDRTPEGLPGYEFAVCSVDGAPVSSHAGFSISPTHDLTFAETADLVAIAPNDTREAPPEVIQVLQRAHARGAWVMSVCTGAFTLGRAGLLDDRRCTTHWRYTDRLAAEFPDAKVDPGVLYVVDDNILTSAGTAAAIDCGLHLIREEQGSAVAAQIARRMVVPPHRDGGQAQYIETPIHSSVTCETIQPLLTHVLETLDRAHTVDTMADQVHMAPRTFARRFRSETGATPHDWLTNQRVLLARRLLEDTDLGIDSIANRAGFGSAQTLRHHFTQRLSTTPQNYRSTFKTKP